LGEHLAHSSLHPESRIGFWQSLSDQVVYGALELRDQLERIRKIIVRARRESKHILTSNDLGVFIILP
jgi:hypothetical protein